jgi:phosphoglycerate dehydrogenase-like enzyme
MDEPALLAAVKSGHLYGAGLDVVKNEPVSQGNPLLMDHVSSLRHISQDLRT